MMNKGLTGGPVRGHKPGEQDIARKQAANIYDLCNFVFFSRSHSQVQFSPQANEVVVGTMRGHKPGKRGCRVPHEGPPTSYAQAKEVVEGPRGTTNQQTMDKGLTGSPKRGHNAGKQDIARNQAAHIYATFISHSHLRVESSAGKRGCRGPHEGPQTRYNIQPSNRKANKVVEGPMRGQKPGKLSITITNLTLI
eukprot:scaffold712_cov69-Cyclotella_meneghiniana.AAC.8